MHDFKEQTEVKKPTMPRPNKKLIIQNELALAVPRKKASFWHTEKPKQCLFPTNPSLHRGYTDFRDFWGLEDFTLSLCKILSLLDLFAKSHPNLTLFTWSF